MNRTVSVKTLLTVLLALSFIASSSLALIYYQRAITSELRAKALATSLSDAKTKLDNSRSQLKGTIAQLTQTNGQLSQAQAESQHRLSVIFAQEDNVNVLKSCLSGVAADDVYFKRGTDAFLAWTDSRSDDDYDTALDNFRSGREALDSVDADCNKASNLLQ